MMQKFLFTLSFITLSLTLSLAQKGFLSGNVLDGEYGDPMFMANVVQVGSTNGATTDFDGNYSLNLDPGTYSIQFSFIGYADVTITGVVITEGETTTLNTTLKPSTAALEEVTVTAEQAKNTEVAILTFKKKSVNMVDGISSQSFKKVGDSDLGASIKRVTGVSVEGGKFVYVRGLGDRYTKTILNGMAIPGLDPDRNAVQMDIFPTSVLENVAVYKTFSPNLYGDFTGGIVDVQTRSFPQSKTTSLSFGLTYNPDMHLNSNYVTYSKGGLDVLGFDNGDRALPFDKTTIVPDETQNDPLLGSLTGSFNNTMATMRANSFMNTSLSFTHGNQINTDTKTYGYNVVLNYRNQFEFYENIQFGEWRKEGTDITVNELRPESVRRGDLGKNDVLWSALVSGAMKWEGNSITAILLHTQNGVSSAFDRVTQNFESNVSTLLEDILTYTQRSISNNTIIGKHQLTEDLNFEWTNSFSYSRINDPDFRITSLSLRDDGKVYLAGGDGAQINRFYRDLNEFNESVKADFTLPINSMEKSNVKAGFSYTYKRRDFEVLNYTFDVTDDLKSNGVSEDADWFFRDENIWNATNQSGTYLIGNFEPANTFDANQHTIGVYAMSEMQLFLRLRAIYGLRVEKNSMFYTGQNNQGNIVLNNEKTLDETNLLPSINLVYAVNDEVNLRASYNKTLARPTFIEKSVAQIYDPITGRTRLGNLDLEQTNINNFDLRLEYFLTPGEIISISGFFKKFDGHIEWVSIETDPSQLKPRNSGSSTVVGAEFEVRKNMEFINPSLKGLFIGGNVSVIRSAVDLTTVFIDDNKTVTELEKRTEVARTGEIVSDTRTMAGQSPYLVNAYINYGDVKSGINGNLSYNVQGESLAIVGSGNVPDVFTKPFHSLNFNTFKDFGKDNRFRLTLSVQNILGDEKEQLYQSYEATDKIYSIFRPGRTFGLKFGMKF